MIASFALLVATVSVPAWADPQSVHEITANWVGDPLPTEAPFGQPMTAEFHVNTNDTQDPYSNAPVANVRATLTAGNGVFTSIPPICKTSGVTPVSEISADGTILLCNLGTIDEGTASVIRAVVRANSTQGGDLTVTGTATSDTAVAEAGPADAGPLPITYVHGMDLSLAQAPGNFQGLMQTSRLGDTRPFLQMNYSLILSAGSRPGPATYSFPVNISANIAGATNGLTWEGCVPIGDGSRSTGQPFSDPAKPDRANFPTCSVSGSGTSYTVTLSNLDYTLVNTPSKDSMGQALPGSGAYVASGTVRFSIPAQVTAITNYNFSASPGQFVFDDAVSMPDANAANNVSSATLQPSGSFSNIWAGTPTYSRSVWDANLWVSPGTSTGIVLPVPGLDTVADWDQVVAQSQATGSPRLDTPLYMQAQSYMWADYQGPGGAQMAGVCTMSQNPAFVIDFMDGGGHSGGGFEGYANFTTARFFYTTQPLDTKTETCGEAAPSAMWVEVFPPAGSSVSDPRIASNNTMPLPAGVTAVKMTWNPAVDRSGTGFVRAFGHIDPAAPTSGEGWTVGAFNSPHNPATTWPGWPALNGWVNLSTQGGGTVIPGSTYGPNTNAIRDAFRLQGAQGLIEKAVSDTVALPGVPVTYTLRAQAQNLVTSPPPTTFTVVDTLPVGMVYVPGTGSPAPTSVSADGRTLTWTFTNVAANVFHEITYQAQRPADSATAPGTRLVNTAVINATGDNRPASTAGRSASATVTVPAASASVFGKSTEANVLSFEGDSSAWRLTINSRDPFTNAFTDTIDILPAVGDGRGTNIDGTYTVTGVTAPAGSTVYYTSAPPAALSLDSRDPSNGGTPGSVSGNTVGWSTTPIDHPTAIRVIGPALAPGATQTIRILYSTPAGSNCEAPAAGDNKAGQILVNSAGAYAGHTALPMLSSATTQIGNCYAANLKKYVQDADGQWHDANTIADYPTFHPGDTVRYRVVIENTGQGPLTGIVITDDKQPQLGSFTVDELAPGASETHEYTITLPADAAVGIVNTVSATTDTPPDVDEPPTIPSDPAGIEVANYTVAKTADPASGTGVLPGDTITYTITVTQQGTAAAAASWQDDLAGLLDDAAYNGDAAATIGTVSLAGDVLEWSGTLQPGETATITYSVTVDAAEALGDGLVTNVVFSPGCTDGCETEHPVRFVVQIEKLGEAEDASWVRMDGSVFELLEDLNGQPGGVLAAPAPIEIALGLFEVSGIQPGTYWLRETAAPVGFSLLAQPVQFTVHPHGTVTIDANGGDVVSAVGSLITVRDVPAMELPEAGGAGTFIFSAIGVLTLVAALTMALVLRRRRQHRTREEVTGTHEPS
ncbi:SpaA isopeptide-forming pilin-related protein [Leifsonia sp. H3M29-4]|uniref:DUF7927 domain-containing protein n=1 Tax=Salinibacterium metalliresistens TaxID=3031321 RepID=UPI0023D9ECEF|nr:SpaA isopeptide-forming pilin-related protein [Salinibacterium metalliresistens]MDF1479311.1 SpaA isopeptide-forming pilin-related protein [Salinibacterium metalliresistens]